MDARKKFVTCFTKTMGLYHYATTYIVLENFQEIVEEYQHFMEMMKVKVT